MLAQTPVHLSLRLIAKVINKAKLISREKSCNLRARSSSTPSVGADPILTTGQFSVGGNTPSKSTAIIRLLNAAGQAYGTAK
jgi:hypothetical protein